MADDVDVVAELKAMIEANKKKETAVGAVMKNGGGAVAGGTLGYIGGGALAVALAPFTGGASLLIPVLTGVAGAVAGHKVSKDID
jgi:hypothetical protein